MYPLAVMGRELRPRLPGAGPRRRAPRPKDAQSGASFKITIPGDSGILWDVEGWIVPGDLIAAQ